MLSENNRSYITLCLAIFLQFDSTENKSNGQQFISIISEYHFVVSLSTVLSSEPLLLILKCDLTEVSDEVDLVGIEEDGKCPTLGLAK